MPHGLELTRNDQRFLHPDANPPRRRPVSFRSPVANAKFQMPNWNRKAALEGRIGNTPQLTLPRQQGLEVSVVEASSTDEPGPANHPTASFLRPLAFDAE